MKPDAEGKRDHREDDGASGSASRLWNSTTNISAFSGPTREIQCARVQDQIPGGQLLLRSGLLLDLCDLMRPCRGASRRTLNFVTRYQSGDRSRLVDGPVGSVSVSSTLRNVVDQAPRGAVMIPNVSGSPSSSMSNPRSSDVERSIYIAKTTSLPTWVKVRSLSAERRRVAAARGGIGRRPRIPRLITKRQRRDHQRHESAATRKGGTAAAG